MSKESYARGFVKAAAAAGVDPTSLAKFAQEFKTNGWAPNVVSALGTDKAIKYYPPDIKHPYEYARHLSDDQALDFSDASSDHPSRFKLSPLPGYEYIYNWAKAHQKARAAASKAPKGMAGKAYHNSMLNLTGTPVRVSAPLKK